MSSATTIATMVIIMLSINIGLAMLQEGVNSIEPETLNFYNQSASPYSAYVNGDIVDGVSVLDDTYLPSDDGAVEGDNDDWNVFKSIKSWFKTSKLATSLSFLADMFSQPASFLRDIGVPTTIALGIQVIWGLLFLIFITGFIMGR